MNKLENVPPEPVDKVPESPKNPTVEFAGGDRAAEAKKAWIPVVGIVSTLLDPLPPEILILKHFPGGDARVDAERPFDRRRRPPTARANYAGATHRNPAAASAAIPSANHRQTVTLAPFRGPASWSCTPSSRELATKHGDSALEVLSLAIPSNVVVDESRARSTSSSRSPSEGSRRTSSRRSRGDRQPPAATARPAGVRPAWASPAASRGRTTSPPSTSPIARYRKPISDTPKSSRSIRPLRRKIRGVSSKSATSGARQVLGKTQRSGRPRSSERTQPDQGQAEQNPQTAGRSRRRHHAKHSPTVAVSPSAVFQANTAQGSGSAVKMQSARNGKTTLRGQEIDHRREVPGAPHPDQRKRAAQAERQESASQDTRARPGDRECTRTPSRFAPESAAESKFSDEPSRRSPSICAELAARRNSLAHVRIL